MYLAGYLYGHRLQFHDWWIDGRIPMRSSTHLAFVSKESADQFFSVAYASWRNWSKRARSHFINFLYVHSRAPAYYWEWEQFAMEYMVTDALFKLANLNFGVPKGIHGERMYALCKRFGIRRDKTTLQRIVNLRNNLQHEAIWNLRKGAFPAQASFNQRCYVLTRQLRCLNQRLIPAMLGFTGEYIRSDWRIWKVPHLF